MIDHTEKNFAHLNSIKLANTAEPEMVDALKEQGRRLHFSKGIWWQEVKPFFYSPVQQFKALEPASAAPKPYLALGGYYHVVPDRAQSNGAIVLTEISDPGSFAFEKLNKSVRYEIRKGLANLELRRISDPNQLLTEGYEIYRNWLGRTPDAKEKKSRQDFQKQFAILFRQPRNLCLGAFHDHRLIAFIVADVFDHVAYLRYSYSHADYHNLFPSAALNYAYIAICTQDPEIKKITNGLKSHKPSLDNFKFKFGYHHTSYPALIKINPIIEPIAKLIFPIQYKRLMGQDIK